MADDQVKKIKETEEFKIGGAVDDEQNKDISNLQLQMKEQMEATQALAKQVQDLSEAVAEMGNFRNAITQLSDQRQADAVNIQRREEASLKAAHALAELTRVIKERTLHFKQVFTNGLTPLALTNETTVNGSQTVLPPPESILVLEDADGEVPVTQSNEANNA